jgi:hypothetical protein
MKGIRLDIMLPVYHGNLLEISESIGKQVDFFEEALNDYDWKIVLAINGKGADEVIELARKLHKDDERITYDYIEQAGKGSGIIHAWSGSDAEIISYMDIDLSTDIKGFPNLISQIEKGFDISIGSRFHPDSTVSRSWKRKIVSFMYHKIFMKAVLGAKNYTDGQCGFKAVNQRVIREILPLIRNRNWFFESEMLYIAQRKGFRIKEVPVHWVESEFSGMKLYRAIFEFIGYGVGLRLRKIR